MAKAPDWKPGELEEAKAAMRIVVARAGTLRDAARDIGVSHECIRRWCQRGVSARYVLTVAAASGVPAASLRPDLFRATRP